MKFRNSTVNIRNRSRKYSLQYVHGRYFSTTGHWYGVDTCALGEKITTISHVSINNEAVKPKIFYTVSFFYGMLTYKVFLSKYSKELMFLGVPSIRIKECGFHSWCATSLKPLYFVRF